MPPAGAQAWWRRSSSTRCSSRPARTLPATPATRPGILPSWKHRAAILSGCLTRRRCTRPATRPRSCPPARPSAGRVGRGPAISAASPPWSPSCSARCGLTTPISAKRTGSRSRSSGGWSWTWCCPCRWSRSLPCASRTGWPCPLATGTCRRPSGRRRPRFMLCWHRRRGCWRPAIRRRRRCGRRAPHWPQWGLEAPDPHQFRLGGVWGRAPSACFATPARNPAAAGRIASLKS